MSKGVPASSENAPTELSALIAGYRLCAKSEAKSQKTIDIVADSVRYLAQFSAFRRPVYKCETHRAHASLSLQSMPVSSSL
ncbi:MAG: hypothetical protein Q7T04_01195 [Dehalococcoidia bacterium]|nr:hypothetical protein [Dehalococcoidia bacterium]